MSSSIVTLVGSVSLLTVPTIVACVSAVRYRRLADEERDQHLALAHTVSLLPRGLRDALTNEADRFRRAVAGDPQARAELKPSVTEIVRRAHQLRGYEDLDSYADEALRVVADGVQGLHETFDRGIDRLNGKVDEAERQIGGAR